MENQSNLKRGWKYFRRPRAWSTLRGKAEEGEPWEEI